jgi:integrin alpha FG-GAP repeat containing protein 1
MKSTSFHHPEPIYNVVPGDFTHDGKLDLLVMSQGTRQSELALSLYVALPEGGFGTYSHLVSLQMFI